MIATGSVPFVPPGIPIDGKTVFTSDHALKLEWIPDWVAIIGSGYIGLEFSDVYTALGSEVTFVEAMPNIMPGFDPEIAKMVRRYPWLVHLQIPYTCALEYKLMLISLSIAALPWGSLLCAVWTCFLVVHHGD